MIRPTVGRVVWFRPVGLVALAAIIAHVHDDRLVNLCVIDSDGRTYGLSSVPLVQPGDEIPRDSVYCEWMPYQVGQAQKAEQLQEQLDAAKGG